MMAKETGCRESWTQKTRRHPAVWFLGGLLATAIGIGCLVGALVSVAKAFEIDDLPRCTPRVTADNCVSAEHGLVANDGRDAGTPRAPGWLFGVKEWLVITPSSRNDQEWLEFRTQRGREQLTRRELVTVKYVDHEAVWMELDDGTTLTTEGHPAYEAPMLVAIGLFAGGFGAGAVILAARGDAREGLGIGKWPALVSGIGLLLIFFQYLLPEPAPGSLVVVALLLLGLAAAVWRNVAGRIGLRRSSLGSAK